MRCSDVDPRLASYVDDETPPDERAEIDEHLHVCRPCRDRADAERTARNLVRANRELLRGTAPDALRARCTRLCAGETAHARTRSFAAELTLDHLKCTKLGARVTGTPADLARYWRQTVGWPVVVPDA